MSTLLLVLMVVALWVAIIVKWAESRNIHRHDMVNYTSWQKTSPRRDDLRPSASIVTSAPANYAVTRGPNVTTKTVTPPTTTGRTFSPYADHAISALTAGLTKPLHDYVSSISRSSRSHVATAVRTTSLYARGAVRRATSTGGSTEKRAPLVTAASGNPWASVVLPAWWMRQAMCVHRYETYGLDPYSWASWHDTRNPVSRGGMQFIPSTWRRVGGTGDPAAASKLEQLYRAWVVWNRDGGSWREWSTARKCGLK